MINRGSSKAELSKMLVILLVLMAFVPLLAVRYHTNTNDVISNSACPIPCEYSRTARSALVINGDSSFNSTNGVSAGAGTTISPYIIENWEIDGHGGTCVFITNTTAIFILRNCILSNATAGVYMRNVSGGRIFNDTISSCDYGVRLNQSTSCTLRNLTISGSSIAGVYTSSSSSNSLANSSFDANRHGVLCDPGTSGIGISNNIFTSSSSYDIVLNGTTSANVALNTLGPNGMLVKGTSKAQWTTHTIASSNTVPSGPIEYIKNATSPSVSGTYGQLIVANCSSVTVSGRTLSNGAGIVMGFVAGGLVSGNSIAGGSSAVFLQNCSSLNIRDNAFSGASSVGVQMMNSQGNTVENNTFSNCAGLGISLGACSSNTIFHNNFTSNNAGNPQAFDSSSSNYWNSTDGIGNYWSDYVARYPTATSYENVWSEPYIVGLGQDNFPLVDIGYVPPSANTIYINGDSEFTSANGVSSGTGTFADPYIIEDKTIAMHSIGNCIFINNTSKYARLRNITIEGGNVSTGIMLQRANNVTLYGVTIRYCSTGILARNSANLAINQSNVFSSSMQGIKLYQCQNSRINGTTVDDCFAYGIYMAYSNNNRVTWCDISHCSNSAIYLTYANGTQTCNNTIHENGYAVYIDFSYDCAILDSDFSMDTGSDIYIDGSGILIQRNDFHDPLWRSVALHKASSCTIVDNTFVGSGVYMKGNDLSHFNTHIMTGNTVNGRPLYYWANTSNIVVPSDAGQAIVANCTGISADGLDISSATIPFILEYSKNIAISNSHFANSNYGVMIHACNYATLVNCSFDNDGLLLKGFVFADFATLDAVNCTVNSKPLFFAKNATRFLVPSNQGQVIVINCSNYVVTGLSIDRASVPLEICYSSWGVISGNVFANSTYGLYIVTSTNNTIVNNRFENNELHGVSIVPISKDNVIASNSFVGNAAGSPAQGNDDGGPFNKWDNNITGNYWSNYEERYPDAVNDGNYWNQSYAIDGSSKVYDMHPKVAWTQMSITIPEYVAPTLGAPALSPSVPNAFECVNVTVSAFDASGISRVWLAYGVNGTAVTGEIDLVDIGSGNYECTIPGQAGGSSVAFTIHATDAFGNTASASGNYTVAGNVAPQHSYITVLLEADVTEVSTGGIVNFNVTVLYEDSTPCAGAAVEMPGASCTTDAHGKCFITVAFSDNSTAMATATFSTFSNISNSISIVVTGGASTTHSYIVVKMIANRTIIHANDSVQVIVNVTYDDGLGCAGALANLSGTMKWTDSNGNCTFVIVIPATTAFQASATFGQFTNTSSALQITVVQQGEHTGLEIAFSLSASTCIFVGDRLTATGNVTYEDGSPAQGVSITISGITGMTPATATSDAQGRFTTDFEVTSAGTSNLIATAMLGSLTGTSSLVSLQASAATCIINISSDKLSINKGGEVIISGTAVNGRGEPIPALTITITIGNASDTTVTATNGTFHLKVKPACVGSTIATASANYKNETFTSNSIEITIKNTTTRKRTPGFDALSSLAACAIAIAFALAIRRRL